MLVQRPSPESETRPSKPARSPLRWNASAARSSSQDATTLPRRQTSVTAGMSSSYWYSSGSRRGVTSALTSRCCRPASAWARMFRPSA